MGGVLQQAGLLELARECGQEPVQVVQQAAIGGGAALFQAVKQRALDCRVTRCLIRITSLQQQMAAPSLSRSSRRLPSSWVARCSRKDFG